MKIACRIRPSLMLAVGFILAAGGSARVLTAATQNAPIQYPHLDEGRKLIMAAQDELSHGATDFGGHRVAAMNQLKQALDEIQAAKDYYVAHHSRKPPQPVPSLPEAPPGPNKYPHLGAARTSLVQAYNALSHGELDFGDHRVKAMDHVKQAVMEIDQAKIYYQTHEK